MKVEILRGIIEANNSGKSRNEIVKMFGVSLSQVSRTIRSGGISYPEGYLQDEWKPIKGTDYEISKNGKVYNVRTNKMVEARFTPGTYSSVGLYINGNRVSYNVSALVASAFLDFDEEKDLVFHLDGNKHNSSVDNLLVIKDSKIENYIDMIVDLQDGEVFVPVNDIPDVMISNHGRVFSCKTMKLLSMAKINTGYMCAVTKRDGMQFSFLIHREVAKHFLDKPNRDNLVVHHKDGDILNNRADNLEWATPSKNTKHAQKNMPEQFNRSTFNTDESCTLEPGEQIKPSPIGNPGLYMVTSYGRVYSNKRKGWIVQTLNGSKYLRVELRTQLRDNSRISINVDKLVAISFLGDKSLDGYVVNHIDGNKTNNRLDNLEWVTRRENALKSFHETGRAVTGKRTIALTDEDLENIRNMYATGNYTYKQIGEIYCIKLQTVSNIVNRLVCYKDR